MINRTAPCIFNDLERPLPDFKVTPLFDAEYLRNCTRYRQWGHSFNGIIGSYTLPLSSVISNDLEWLSKISSDTNRRAVSATASVLLEAHLYAATKLKTSDRSRSFVIGGGAIIIRPSDSNWYRALEPRKNDTHSLLPELFIVFTVKKYQIRWYHRCRRHHRFIAARSIPSCNDLAGCYVRVLCRNG